MSLDKNNLNKVFSAIIVSKLTYAIQVFSGSLTRSDIDRIDASLRKARRWGITSKEYEFCVIAALADSRLQGSYEGRSLSPALGSHSQEGATPI